MVLHYYRSNCTFFESESATTRLFEDSGSTKTSKKGGILV